jgi:hypothetical protein
MAGNGKRKSIPAHPGFPLPRSLGFPALAGSRKTGHQCREPGAALPELWYQNFRFYALRGTILVSVLRAAEPCQVFSSSSVSRVPTAAFPPKLAQIAVRGPTAMTGVGRGLICYEIVWTGNAHTFGRDYGNEKRVASCW